MDVVVEPVLSYILFGPEEKIVDDFVAHTVVEGEEGDESKKKVRNQEIKK